ncbi:DNA replication regulator SLD3-domain-containing protein [Coniochaeta sp. 2T2.1]|nr:DNA replication regulator SLD3-domain-containing protein [Coniochaeta sp. 2T2.1]
MLQNFPPETVVATEACLTVPCLQPHPSTIHVKPCILSPLILLPREHLPLSALDLSAPHGDFSASRFYESRIKILDLEGRLGSNVLLARLESKRVVYAIERHDDGLYTLCKVGPWVDMRLLAQFATVICQERLRSVREPVSQAGAGQVPLITPQIHKDNKRRRLAIEEIQSLVKKRARSQSIATVLGAEQSQSLLPQPNSPAEQSPPVEDVSRTNTPVLQEASILLPQQASPDVTSSQPTAEGIFENIRNSYVEALYHSMGSLAYFAKGPLSRARAAFHLDCDSNLDMNDLIDFLKNLAMTTVVIDKKYRETLPEVIANMKTIVEDSDHEIKTKKRKAKKMKLGKDGLYPHEAEHVSRWWRANKPQVADDKSVTPNEVKYHISCLRRRETQLQMIIIMEILALEPLTKPRDTAEDSQLPGMESQSGLEQTAAEPLVKKRNKHNFPVLLDVHADRLCIWQSTIPEEMKALAENQVHSQGHSADKSGRPNSDPLKDFCVDIILPFFSARLPDICDSINRKLGGPVIMPPPKPTQVKPASKPKVKPGAPTKRPASRRDREKTLERVLSNERLRRSVSRGPTSALAHMRSASATAIPGLKREASEPLMGMMPPKREMSSLKDRSTNLFSRSSSSSSLVTDDQKAKKKAQVDAELMEAILALKRPNRAMVGKEIVEETEQRRAATSLSQLKKSKKPVRDPAFGRTTATAAIQVKATPANNRFKDVIAAESKAQILRTLQEEDVVKDEHVLDDDRIPASSSVVPSSTAPRRVTAGLNYSSPAVNATPVAGSRLVQATPARTTHAPPFSEFILPVSPVLTRKSIGTGRQSSHLPAGQSSATLVQSSLSPGGEAGAAAGGIFETPLKPRSAMDVVCTPVRPLRLGPGSGAVAATPEMKKDLAVATTPEMKKIAVVATTPRMKKVAVAPPNQEDDRNATARGTQQQPVSIYQQLGWDDDYDLD